MAIILSRPKEELGQRVAAIRRDFDRRYRDQDALRQELFDEQSGLCPVCKRPIQSADSVVAEIDHATPIYCYATWNWPIEAACEHANARGNLVLLHSDCNVFKSNVDLEELLEQIERGEVTLPGEPKILTPEQIVKMKAKLSEIGRKGGRKGGLAATALLTPKQLRERGRKLNASLTPEQRRVKGRKAGLATAASLTPEQRREKGVLALSPIFIGTLIATAPTRVVLFAAKGGWSSLGGKVYGNRNLFGVDAGADQ